MATKVKKVLKKIVKKVKKAAKKAPLKLSDSEIKKIFVLHKKGKTQREIAREIGRSRSAVFYQLNKVR